MKKMMKMAVLAAALTLSANASAQTKLGLKGGINTSEVSVNDDVWKTDNRLGFFIGPTVKFTLPIVGLGMDISALYEKRESKMKSEDGKLGSVVSREQLAIPINARYSFGLGETANIFLFAGPQVAFNLGKKDKEIVPEVADWTLKSSNFSINLGIGCTLASHLQATIGYNIALGKTGEVELSTKGVETSKKKYDGRSNAWQLGVAYFF
ncbi:MAG: porin family protein [Prevotella conceptionensis]|uniref:porin family protein n=1 Tax=Prevotella conceptionensis TaxID=340486 RepID=UPI0002F95744|nr:porin family protein [Prevotella conceptionensis]